VQARPAGAPGPWGAPRQPKTRQGFACEACGAVLSYAPGTSELKCSYCGHTNRIVEVPVAVIEQALAPALERLGQEVPDSTPLHAKCPSCAAEFDFPANLHAGPCPFCSRPVVLDPAGHRLVLPQAILPFLIGEPEAKRLVGEWLRGLWLAPTGVAEQARGPSRLRGLYVPFWTFDSSTRTIYSGRRGDVWYETRHVTRTVNGRQVTEAVQVPRIRWTSVSGHTARDFDDVLVLAGETLPRQLVEPLEPWDLAGFKPYGADYLAGFESELYQVPIAPAYGSAQAIMRGVITGDVRRDIGGDQQQIDVMDVTFDAPSFKHVLLPVWVAAFQFLGRPYRFVVNGRTGEVHGERPWSALKITLAVLAGLIGLALLAWLFSAAESFRAY
jgi:LSD1 subclass zinc finger protein